MAYIIFAVVVLAGYFFYHKSTTGYQYRSAIKRSKEVRRAINTMAGIVAPTPNQSSSIPHLDAAERNLNRIMAKYVNDKIVLRSAIHDFNQYLQSSVALTSNRINAMQNITTAKDAIDSLGKLNSDDSSFVLQQIRDRQRSLLGNEYIDFEG